MSAKQRRQVSNKGGDIIEGWLQDEVIGSFFYKLCQREDAKYCEAALALHLAKEGNTRVSSVLINESVL